MQALTTTLMLALAAAPGFAETETPYDVRAEELIAVRLVHPEFELELGEILDRYGLELRKQAAFGPREFRLIELTHAVPAADVCAALLSDLLADARVEFATEVYRDELGLPEFPSRQLIVRFEPGVPEAAQRALLETRPGLREARRPWEQLAGWWMVDTTARFGDEVIELAADLREVPGVLWAQPDLIAGARLDDFLPNDPLFFLNWGLHNTGGNVVGSVLSVADVDMDLPEAWDIAFGSGITVVVLDGGVDLSHPDMPVPLGADFTGQNQGGAPINLGACHGTAVAGCIGAAINNNLGTTGSAPGCTLASAAVMIPQDPFQCTISVSISSGWLIGGLNYALLLGARVTCSSFGMGYDQSVADAYNVTKSLGVIHFASAGNNSPSAIGFPASDDDTVAVGNLRADGTLSPSSQTGPALDLVAPGTSIVTTDWSGGPFGYVSNSDYATVNGTSFAAPYAAGVAALILSKYPLLTPEEVRLIMKMSADDYGSTAEDDTFGAGLVNAYRALQVATDFAQGSVRAYNGPGLHPWFTTVKDAVNGAGPGQLVLVHQGSFAESLTITKAVKLRQWTNVAGSSDSAVVGE